MHCSASGKGLRCTSLTSYPGCCTQNQDDWTRMSDSQNNRNRENEGIRHKYYLRGICQFETGATKEPQRSVWTRQKFSVSSCPLIFHIGCMSREKSHHLLEYCNPTGKWNCTIRVQVTAPRSLSRNATGCLSKLFRDRILRSKGWLCAGEHQAVQVVAFPLEKHKPNRKERHKNSFHS